MTISKSISSILIVIFSFGILSCETSETTNELYETSTLKITPLTEKVFVHTSYLEIPDYGTFPCNGMIYVHNKEALIFDTPTTDNVSLELINWVESELKCKIIGVLATHFHNDCLGGLKAFHDLGIKSYGNYLTITMVNEDSLEIPFFGFDNEYVLHIGDSDIIINYFGEGHTKDNVVAYVEAENVLFGGCLIKEKDAKKGYLGDANVEEWSNTVTKIKKAYPNLKYVIPGHGEVGGTELLDYTIDLFN